MTDTKPTLEEAAHQDWCRWWNHGDMCSCGAVSAIRSAELPVEPEFFKNFRADAVIHTAHENESEVSDLVAYIDALKAYALKEKERADGLQKIQDEAESILFSVGDITCANGHKHKRHDGCLYCLAEKAEAELAALRGRLMEPDYEMRLVGERVILEDDSPDDRPATFAIRIFKAMSAVALKEGK